MPVVNLPYFIDYQIIVTVMMVAAAWKWGDWKNWRIYYPTILFYIVVDFSYVIVSYNYPLWEFESPMLKTILSEFLISCVFVPATLLMYLYRFPKGFTRKILYIFFWVALYSLIELFSYLFGFFSYHNGWNLWWSVLFNCIMFPILYLHQKKPLGAIGISLICAVVMILWWKIPVGSMK